VLLQPPHPRGLVMALDDREKEALASDPVLLRALDRGWAICAVDVRGIGEMAVAERGWIFAVSLLAGDNFVWRQAADLLSVSKAMTKAPPFAGKPVALYARGDNAALAATYAIGEEPELFKWYVLRHGFLSYRQFMDRPESMPASFRLLDQDRREERLTAFDREIPFSYFPFDVLAHFDLPDLLGMAAGMGFVLEPLDGDWKTIPRDAAQGLAPGSVRVVEGIAEIEKVM